MRDNQGKQEILFNLKVDGKLVPQYLVLPSMVISGRIPNASLLDHECLENPSLGYRESLLPILEFSLCGNTKVAQLLRVAFLLFPKIVSQRTFIESWTRVSFSQLSTFPVVFYPELLNAVGDGPPVTCCQVELAAMKH